VSKPGASECLDRSACALPTRFGLRPLGAKPDSARKEVPTVSLLWIILIVVLVLLLLGFFSRGRW
jgi:hypothetical protein